MHALPTTLVFLLVLEPLTSITTFLRTPATDPRLDKTYAAKFLAFGMGGISPPLPTASTYEVIADKSKTKQNKTIPSIQVRMITQSHILIQETKEKVIPGVAEGYKQFFDAIVQDVPVYDVKKREVLIDGTHPRDRYN